MTDRTKVLCCIVLVTTLAASWGVTKLFLTITSTFDGNGQWVATKPTLHKPPIGGCHFGTERQTLRRGRLDLGAWFGFQEVWSRNVYPIGSISLRMFLVRDAYLVLLLQGQSAQDTLHQGIRLSAGPLFESAYLTIDPHDRFVAKQKLPAANQRPGRWVSVRVALAGGSTSLFVDDKRVGEFPSPRQNPLRLGFRCGYSNAYLDDIEVRSPTGKLLMSESFNSGRHRVEVMLSCFLLLTVIKAACLRCARRRGTPHPQVLMSLITFDLVVLLTLVVVLSWYSLVYSRSYPFEGDRLREKEIEFVAASTADAAKRLQESCPVVIGSGVCRILFLGTSQTWGEGVSRPGDEFVSLIEKRLNESSIDFGKFECINAGIPGQESPGLLRLYEEELVACQHDLLVLNLSNNDRDPAAFSHCLTKFAQLNRQRRIRTIFVMEPNAVDKWPGDMPMHPIMRDVAERLHVPLIDLHAYMRDHRDVGFLWWDHVHPTSLGHRFIADRLFEAITACLTDDESRSHGE